MEPGKNVKRFLRFFEIYSAGASQCRGRPFGFVRQFRPILNVVQAGHRGKDEVRMMNDEDRNIGRGAHGVTRPTISVKWVLFIGSCRHMQGDGCGTMRTDNGLSESVKREFNMFATGGTGRLDVFRHHQCDGGFAMRAGDFLPQVYGGKHNMSIAQGAGHF
jgi:hypothetical protein